MIDHGMMNLLDQYGYWGLFGLLVLGIVGLPLPDEALLTFAGYQISQGRMHFAGALAAAFLGSVVGITLSFLLGRLLGKEVVARFGRFLHLTEERLLRVEHYMERYGGLALFFGYFVPGLRHLTALSAGFGQMKFRIFAPFAYLGALFWTVTFLLLGHLFSNQLHHLEKVLYPYRFWILAVVVVSFVTPLVWRTISRRRGKADENKTREQEE
ncbi:membrane protein DedA with SNARE-associated domain [Tumebacillus sp. BK434]|uniref:DedA family protein n=1 Tax=Tumebacillus sp. BK434 TaxID=2512169 RepID=UPI0010440C57|nr:DedA family protein [Tumebacillus sp. BK434]TCP55531.1 membrane protein DedA with SNARE-associated domain [Tumebacillus sp. BK434]